MNDACICNVIYVEMRRKGRVIGYTEFKTRKEAANFATNHTDDLIESVACERPAIIPFEYNSDEHFKEEAASEFHALSKDYIVKLNEKFFLPDSHYQKPTWEFRLMPQFFYLRKKVANQIDILRKIVLNELNVGLKFPEPSRLLKESIKIATHGRSRFDDREITADRIIAASVALREGSKFMKPVLPFLSEGIMDLSERMAHSFQVNDKYIFTTKE